MVLSRAVRQKVFQQRGSGGGADWVTGTILVSLALLCLAGRAGGRGEAQGVFGRRTDKTKNVGVALDIVDEVFESGSGAVSLLIEVAGVVV